MKNLYHQIYHFNLKSQLLKQIKQADKPFWSAFFSVFIVLNLIFLYHGAHFLFGDHDWFYAQKGIALNSSLFEGHFSQFILTSLLTGGEILPIINNAFGFLGFSLGIALLAHYWQVPHTRTNYIVFSLFTAITPYILSSLYSAFLVIPVLSWNAFIIAGLLISARESIFSWRKTISSVFLLTISLGGYPPVINLIAISLCVRLLIEIAERKTSLPQLWQTYRWSIINIILSFIAYKLCLIYLSSHHLINYNLQIIPFAEWPQKAISILPNIFRQFTITFPFIGEENRVLNLAIILLGTISLYQHTLTPKRFIAAIFLIILLFYSELLISFLSPAKSEADFSPHIAFWGYIYIIAAFLRFALISKQQILKNFTFIVALISIITSSHHLFEAEKVWKLGFDAEMKLYQRVAKRFQNQPNFTLNRRYIIIQGGTFPFREHFYHDNYRHPSEDLLAISYVPGMASGVMWNYYGITDYAHTTPYAYFLNPDPLLQQAIHNITAWPKANSIQVGPSWILLPLTTDGITELQRHYKTQ
ncbi:MAG: hypothetical protein IJ864_00290 [Alphaproteobacteria bacterium]|nr:hypothetical protein [Alphaproteobacteria bacterium]